MKVAIIGDLHIGVKNNSPVFLDYMKNYFDNEFFKYLIEHDIHEVIQLGDTLDKRKTIDFGTSAFLIKEWFKKFDDYDIRLNSLIGNHDTYFKNTNELSGVKQYESLFHNVHIINKCETLILDGLKFHCVPWICTENQEEVNQYIASNEGGVLCGHFELAGFNINKNFISQTGNLDVAFLESKYPLILSGHYHTPSDKGAVRYVGTPYQLTWADYGDAKKFIVLDTEAPTDYEEMLTKSALYYKIIYQAGMSVNDVMLPERAYVKVLVNEASDLLDVFVNELTEKFNLSQCQVVDTSNTQAQTEDELETLEIDDPFHILLNSIKSINDTYITEELTSIYREAQSMEG